VFFERLPGFIAQHYVLVALFAVVVVMLLQSEWGRLNQGFRMVGPAELVRLINRENALLVDVSSPAEFAQAHIVGARHLALAQFDPENKELAKVRDLPVIVVCRNGSAARGACARLVKAGFSKVQGLEGGVNAWIAAEMPVVKGRA